MSARSAFSIAFVGCANVTRQDRICPGAKYNQKKIKLGSRNLEHGNLLYSIASRGMDFHPIHAGLESTRKIV